MLFETPSKNNVAFNLFYRTLSISDENVHDDNINTAFNILSANNYPHKIIQKQLHRAKQKLATQNTTETITQTQSEPQTEHIYKGIHFIPNISQPIADLVKKGRDDLLICFKPSKPLRSTLTKHQK